ncbi:MAG: hypothetical protein HY698_15190 [Deltaproteobacteria bacterium]|nr:hypothetical protein [Deltaproteobacteria bacterium]
MAAALAALGGCSSARDGEGSPGDRDASLVPTPDGSTKGAPADASGVDAPGRQLDVEVLSPSTRSVFEAGTRIEFLGRITDSLSRMGDVEVTWESNINGVLFKGAPGNGGSTQASSTTLAPGYHTITLTARAPSAAPAQKSIVIGICTWTSVASFDSDLPSGWTIFGHAYRDSRGWLEMTGNLTGRKGAIFYTRQPIAPGNITLRFRIATGQCDNPGPCTSGTGADGFAMSIIEAASPEKLGEILTRAEGGGGLGYGVSGGYGNMTIRAFHVEFDTWQNIQNPNTEYHTDPTSSDHVAITLNGDPGKHYLWANIPDLEDNKWHDVIVEIQGDNVRVTIDAKEVMTGPVEGLDFKGGYIGFSGTTGFYTNYHRFDELGVQESCRFD